MGTLGEKFHAENAAQRVAGVKAIAVEIDVRLSGTSQRTDAEIAASAEKALQWSNHRSGDRIRLKVESRRIVLSGELGWDYQRLAAALAVRFLHRVTSVDDHIMVKRRIAITGVQSDIEAALQRRAHTGSQAIGVSVHGTEVTLSGKVHSSSKRDLATSAAWGSAGVYKVVNNIELIG